jgi:GxxExxY protein
MMADLVYKDASYLINGACFEVYKEKGCGFLEDVYQECLEIEFELQGIEFVAQYPLKLKYKGRPLRKKYIPDFICMGKIIVDFGHYPKVQIERIAN